MPDTTPTTADLLRQAETYLTVTHDHAGRHDTIGADLTCAGCQLRTRVTAALLAPARLVLGTTDQQPVTAPAGTELRDRRDRYAAAMALCDGHPEWPVRFSRYQERDYLRRADAVMAVADTEVVQAMRAMHDTKEQEITSLRAEVEGLDEALRGGIAASEKDGIRLRAEVERLRTDRATALRELADTQERTAAMDVIRRRRSIATARRLFAMELRRMADEAPPVHLPKGTNAEDCPACEGTNPDYPFLCPGPTAP